MQCFTVGQLRVYDGIPVTIKGDGHKGIGLLGELAYVPDDTLGLFPPPRESTFVTFKPPLAFRAPLTSIRQADIFRFDGHDSEGRSYRYRSILHAEQADTSQALVWLLLDVSGPYNFSKTETLGTIRVFEDTTRFTPNWQLLMTMEKGSSLILHMRDATATISWNGKDLNVTRKSI